MLATEERTAELSFLAACGVPGEIASLPETRVRGSRLQNHVFIGVESWLSSTTRWGCGYVYDGTASVSLDQRFYASAYGRFLTADPFRATTRSVNNPKDPGSWNRYAYTRGDPVNRLDPSGRDDCLTDNCGLGAGGGDPNCGPDWTTNAGESGPCYSSVFTFPPEINASPNPVSGPTSPNPVKGPPQPKCWQNTGNISATLSNLAGDTENDVSGQFSSADMQLLTSDLNTDISAEMHALVLGADLSAAPSSPYYVGGHFNLDISAAQIAGFSAADQQAFASDFAMGPGDGVRQPAATGLAAALGYTLHSQVGNFAPGEYSFHFDTFNPYSGYGLGAVGHGVIDVLGGHLGHPCLDPAWHQ